MTPTRRGFRSASAASLIVLLAIAGAASLEHARAQDHRQQLRDVEREMEEERRRRLEIERRASAIAREVERLRGETIESARRLQAEEWNLSTLEDTLAALAEEIARQQAALDERRRSVEALVTAIQRLARQPPEALLALPSAPIDAVRTETLLGRALPAVAREAAALRKALAELADLQAQTARKRDEATVAHASVARQRTALDALLARRLAARGGVESEARRQTTELQRLAARAGDLRELIERAEAERRRQEAEERRRAAEAERREAERQEAARRAAEARRAEAERLAQERRAEDRQAEDRQAEERRAEERRAEERRAEERRARARDRAAQVALARPPAIRPFAGAKGAYRLPSVGRMERRFGDDLGYGQHSRGITIEARRGAAVVAPYDGRILFVGPFRAYGEILIIEHSDGYHSLLAGMARTDGTVGQVVLAGEPVGAMAPDGEERPKLYVELRRNGNPINPQPWLAASESKVSG
ncbi:MAG: murein hydrolase activator EnvC [Alphaproteobacteria bacterium]